MDYKSGFQTVVHWLVILGALNWLFIALQGYDFLKAVGGSNTQLLYLAVGAAGAYKAVCKVMKWM